jgi:hypothetical protein
MKPCLDFDNPHAIVAFVARLHRVVAELDTVANEARRPAWRRRKLTRTQALDRNRRAHAAFAWLADVVAPVCADSNRDGQKGA